MSASPEKRLGVFFQSTFRPLGKLAFPPSPSTCNHPSGLWETPAMPAPAVWLQWSCGETIRPAVLGSLFLRLGPWGGS